MKKVIAVVLIAVLLTAGCAKAPSASTSVSSSSQIVSTASSEPIFSMVASQTASYITKPDDMSAAAFLRQNFPDTDGSTSTIPLDASVRSAIFTTGLDYEAGEVKHTTTFGSFDRLLSGEVDLTYTVPLSAEQKQAAKDKNIELEMVPIAKEAFVFVLNAKNPVTKLSQEQLRGIYSGKITNWKQVGGNDASIVAYQRNLTSGSQTYMTAFMGDIQLIEAPKTLVATSMGGLMDAIALYDNAENAIGYSVYAYAADMYGTGTELKFAAVDGIAPDDTTMKNGTYPLLSENYAIFRASEPKGSPARVLAKWLVTQDGQTAVANGGYIPYGVDPSTVVTHKNAWNKVGTGPKATGKETIPTSYYFASAGEGGYDPSINALSDRAYTVSPVDESELTITSDGITSAGKVWNIKAEFNGLLNAAKNAAVAKFMNDSIAELAAKSGEFESYLEELNQTHLKDKYSSYKSYVMAPQRHHCDGYYWESPISIETACYNGYLSVAVRLRYYSPYEGGTYDCRSAIFDIYTGNRVAFTDLFYAGTDIAALLNDAVKHFANGALTGDSGYVQIRHDNPIVTNEVIDFSLNTIYYPRENHCFTAGVTVDYDLFSIASQMSELRDMSGLWKPAVTVRHIALTETAGNGLRKNGVLADKEKHFYAVQADAYVTETASEKINAAILAYMDEVHAKPLYDYYKATGMTRNELVLYFNPWIAADLKGTLDEFLNDRGITLEYILQKGLEYNQNAPTVICGKYVSYPRAGAYFWGAFLESDYPIALYLPKCLIFDIKTGETIQLSQLYLNGWEKAAKWYDVSVCFYEYYEEGKIETPAPDISDLVLVKLTWGAQSGIASTATFMTKDGKKTYQAEIPEEYLNFA